MVILKDKDEYVKKIYIFKSKSKYIFMDSCYKA